MKSCINCQSQFEIRGFDRNFYKKLDLVEPLECPDCRQQKRLAYRNERILYKRDCDKCNKKIVSTFSSDKSFPVYCQECFWADDWDASDFNSEINFEKPFFDQFYDLMQKVPRLAIVNKQSQNSEYCNYSFANKNCYLTFGNHYEEDCMYGHYSTKNKDCMDYLWFYESELSYGCIFSGKLYRSVYLDHSEGCQDCYFSVDLKGCKHCLFCSNLRHKEYYIFNKKYSKEDYFKQLESYNFGNFKNFSEAIEIFKTEFRKKFPVRGVYKVNCENCEGNNLNNCKNLQNCFDCTACEDCAYGYQMDETYDSMDMNCMGYDKSEVCYQTIGCSGINNCITCDSCWHNNDLNYCNLCFNNSSDLFGCISLNKKKHCILNKQYSKEEYEKLVPQIIEHMKKTGEWGEFFQIKYSPFAYNETVAQEYFPLEKNEAFKNGYKWKEKDPKDYQKQTYDVPLDIKDVKEDIIGELLACVDCAKNYKIIDRELKFYKKLNLPVPRKCPDCRHLERMTLRSPRKLWDRKCAKCDKDMKASYSNDRPEAVYCQDCYLQEVV
ncbi:hypothetical protein ACFLZH_01650 [Patescibacteria group bacterium]